MKTTKVFAASLASFLIAGKSFGTSTTLPLVAGTGSGELAPFNPTTGANGPTSAAAVTNATVLQAAINYANQTYFVNNHVSVANSVTITLPAGAYAFAPYVGYQTGYVELNGMPQTVDLPNMPMSNGVAAGVIDVSGYDPKHNANDFAPLGYLVATIPNSSTTGHLTIMGAGDCVSLNSQSVPVIGSLGCPNGTAIYTEDGYAAIYGDQTNHVTFSELGFNRATEYVSQGTVTGSTKSTVSMSGTFTPGSVTLTIGTGYPSASTLFNFSYETILNSPAPPESRYLRAYSAPTPGNPPEVLAMDGASPNSQEGWAEPDDMQPTVSGGNTQTVGCMAGGAGLYTPAIPGTQTLVGGTLTACQVAPVCPSGSNSCTLYMDGNGAPTYSVGDFVCIKAKYLNADAYNFYGPWNDQTDGEPNNYGGTDVMFSNVSWVQQTVGNTNMGFTNFALNNVYLLRAQAPAGTGVLSPCLASGSGGPQLGAHSSGITYPSNWPAGTNTINGFYAIALGDDTIALSASSGDITVISNATILDSFARGLFLNGVGTYEAPGTSILQTWTLSGDTMTYLTGAVTLSRNAYCITMVPGEPSNAPSLDCVALASYFRNDRDRPYM